jgi:hypothetical protein
MAAFQTDHSPSHEIMARILHNQSQVMFIGKLDCSTDILSRLGFHHKVRQIPQAASVLGVMRWALVAVQARKPLYPDAERIILPVRLVCSVGAIWQETLFVTASPEEARAAELTS